MPGSQLPERRESSGGERTITDVLKQIEDAGQHVGGGTAAAVSGALAAASAALVAGLSAGRKSNRDQAESIRADFERLQALERELLSAAQEDEAALDELMTHYRDRKTPESVMNRALERAALASIAIAAAAAEVCELAARQAPIASRFTVSDLGAAAAIARGATTAALLTAETNVGLLADRETASHATIEDLHKSIGDIEEKSALMANDALTTTRERLKR